MAGGEDHLSVGLALVRAAVDAALPLFGICRGFQEMSV
ncbi:MAG: gamma-glutamyl-gamma-aminobutyrate hydrolase family protein, partial [Pseudomonadota bacterium]